MNERYEPDPFHRPETERRVRAAAAAALGEHLEHFYAAEGARSVYIEGWSRDSEGRVTRGALRSLRIDGRLDHVFFIEIDSESGRPLGRSQMMEIDEYGDPCPRADTLDIAKAAAISDPKRATVISLGRFGALQDDLDPGDPLGPA